MSFLKNKSGKKEYHIAIFSVLFETKLMITNPMVTPASIFPGIPREIIFGFRARFNVSEGGLNDI